jgi:ribose 5-phosphate isomerase B
MEKQKITIGCDHAGFELKEKIKKQLTNKYELNDKGTFSNDSVDYPDFAHAVACAIERHESDFGILLCGSANGVAIAANKHNGVRAAICWNEEVSVLARQHNDANIICIPARFISEQTAYTMVEKFLATSFEGGRHAKRRDKIDC